MTMCLSVFSYVQYLSVCLPVGILVCQLLFLSACLPFFMYLPFGQSVFLPLLCLSTHQSFHKIWLKTLVATLHAQFSEVRPFNMHLFCTWSQTVTRPFTTLSTHFVKLTDTNDVKRHLWYSIMNSIISKHNFQCIRCYYDLWYLKGIEA